MKIKVNPKELSDALKPFERLKGINSMLRLEFQQVGERIQLQVFGSSYRSTLVATLMYNVADCEDFHPYALCIERKAFIKNLGLCPTLQAVIEVKQDRWQKLPYQLAVHFEKITVKKDGTEHFAKGSATNGGSEHTEVSVVKAIHPEAVGEEIDIDAVEFRTAIKHALLHTSRDSYRPAMMGILMNTFANKSDYLRIVTTQGNRLHQRGLMPLAAKSFLEAKGNRPQYVVPQDVWNFIELLPTADNGKTVSIYFDKFGSYVQMTYDIYEWRASLIDEKYPDYTAVLKRWSNDDYNYVSLPVSTLERALMRISGYGSDRKGDTVFRLETMPSEPDAIMLRVSNNEQGIWAEEILNEANCPGIELVLDKPDIGKEKAFEIDLSIEHLTACLKAYDGTVEIELIGKNKPIILRDTNEADKANNFTLMMPCQFGTYQEPMPIEPKPAYEHQSAEAGYVTLDAVNSDVDSNLTTDIPE